MATRGTPAPPAGAGRWRPAAGPRPRRRRASGRGRTARPGPARGPGRVSARRRPGRAMFVRRAWVDLLLSTTDHSLPPTSLYHQLKLVADGEPAEAGKKGTSSCRL